MNTVALAPTRRATPSSRPPLRVLHVVASLDQTYGGPLRAVLDLCAQEEPFGVTSEILGIGAANVPDNPFPDARMHSLPPGQAEGRYRFSAALRPWLRTGLGRFDGVVVHGMWTYLTWAVSEECRTARVPYACFPHGMLEPWAVFGQGPLKAVKKLAYWALRERKTCQSAAQILFTTERERDLASRMVRLRTGSSIVAPFGFAAAMPGSVRPARQDLVQPDGRRVALFLGRVHPKKNAALLVRAWAAAEMPNDWRLVIAGAGDDAYMREITSLVERYSLQSRVSITGFVTGVDKTYLLQRADWFLLPSSQENFGIAVLEAVEQGCAVAISDGVYLAEAFRRESEVLPVDEGAWTSFFRTRMRDPRWRDQTAQHDRDHLLTRYEAGKVAAEWSNAWIRIFGEAPRARA